MEQKLQLLIEQVRAKMVEKATAKQCLNDNEVLELSQLLDSLINMSQVAKRRRVLYKNGKLKRRRRKAIILSEGRAGSRWGSITL